MSIDAKKLRFILSDYSSKGRTKPDLNYSVKSFNFSMRCTLYPPVTLLMACKERYNLCMNRISFVCESLDCVS